MQKEPLPVYQIRDFDDPGRQEHLFYLRTFEEHLREHAFIQKPHKHNFYLLLLFTAGHGSHTIDSQTYPVRPGSLFFLNPGQVHYWQLSADTTGYVLFFSPEFYLLGFPASKLESYPFLNNLQATPFLQLNADEEEIVFGVLRQLQQEYLNRGWKQDELLRNYLDILLVRLGRIYLNQHTPTSAFNPAFSAIRQLQQLIDQHFRKHEPVHFYAGKLGISPKQLNDLSRNTLGKTLTEMLQDRTMLEARRLLLHSDLSITQIAAELGYYDNSYFARFFKKHAGQTPEQFRQQHF